MWSKSYHHHFILKWCDFQEIAKTNARNCSIYYGVFHVDVDWAEFHGTYHIQYTFAKRVSHSHFTNSAECFLRLIISLQHLTSSSYNSLQVWKDRNLTDFIYYLYFQMLSMGVQYSLALLLSEYSKHNFSKKSKHNFLKLDWHRTFKFTKKKHSWNFSYQYTVGVRFGTTTTCR